MHTVLVSGRPAGDRPSAIAVLRQRTFCRFPIQTKLQAPLYFSSGYLKVPEILQLNAKLSVVNWAIWITTATVWWKFLGIY